MLAPELWPGPPGRPVVTGPALHVQDWRGGPLAVLTKHKRPKPVVLFGARSDEFVFFLVCFLVLSLLLVLSVCFSGAKTASACVLAV